MHAAYKKFESKNQNCEAEELVVEIENKLINSSSFFVNCIFALKVALIVDHSLKSKTLLEILFKISVLVNRYLTFI